MNIMLPTNKKPFRLFVTVVANRNLTLRLVAKDTRKPSTYYLNRTCAMRAGSRQFVMKFPLSPDVMRISIFNQMNGNYDMDEDTSFTITEFKPDRLKTCPLWEDKLTYSFINFAQDFAENASVYSAGDKHPHIYRSNDGRFTIDYYDIIRDNGTPTSTPARIGHNRGIIELSKNAFMNYTVPMRMIILLHEFSHKWKNPQIGREIGYETGADINALKIYLSLGYPEIEAHRAFLNVFRKADGEGNHKRYKIINDFITKFNQGLIEGSCERNVA
jgi:hypothetical protein